MTDVTVAEPVKELTPYQQEVADDLKLLEADEAARKAAAAARGEKDEAAEAESDPKPMPEPRRVRAESFAKYFLAHLCRHDFASLHLESLQRYDTMAGDDLLKRRGRRFALAAPRGCAKSSIHTLVLPLMDIAYGREKYIVIISATYKQAKQRLANLRSEIMNNQKLRAAYPGLAKRGRPWSKTAFVCNDVKVEAFGAGAEMRGISWGEMRPTKIILDDAEDSRSAFRSQRREELLAWYDEVVENLGDTYTHIEAVGTVLHRESLLSRLLNRVGYSGKTYRAIESWAVRVDLWNRWKRLYTDLSSETREEDARSFYDANREEMLRGARVLWQPKEDYLYLMEQLVTRGRPAFFKEKQNLPLTGDGQIFDPSGWTFFEVGMDGVVYKAPNPHKRAADQAEEQAAIVEMIMEQENSEKSAKDESCPGEPRPEEEFDALGNEIRPGLKVKEDMKIFGFLDPAVGKNTKKGDYAAIVTVGRDGDGYFYVLDVWMRRVGMKEQLEQAMALHQQYNYVAFGYEDNGYQEMFSNFLEEEKKRRKPQGQPWQLPLRRVTNTIRKHTRISAIEPAISSGWVRFCTGVPNEFILQAEDFPACKHDDGLDALAGAMELAKDFEPKRRKIVAVGRREMVDAP